MITTHEYNILQRGLRDLYAHHHLDSLSKTALKLAAALVPNDLCAYNEVDPTRRRLHAVFEPDDRSEEWIRRFPAWERYMHQHPVLVHYLRHPSDGPRKISDFLSDDEYRSLELYTEFYQKIGANYQIAANMPSPAPLMVALAFNREARDFDEHDRSLLGVLMPHLRQAYENAAVVTELSDELARAYNVLDRIDRGVVALDEEARVLSASPAAARFSVDHFPSDREASLARKLPADLLDWAKVQIAALRQEGDRSTRPQPLIKDGPHGRLVVRTISDQTPGRYLLTMHLARPLESATALEALGLTKREAEVLRWMIEGKSNPEISALVGISVRTIDKHAQNLYAKLEVGGRSEAITHALEWLRL